MPQCSDVYIYLYYFRCHSIVMCILSLLFSTPQYDDVDIHPVCSPYHILFSMQQWCVHLCLYHRTAIYTYNSFVLHCTFCSPYCSTVMCTYNVVYIYLYTTVQWCVHLYLFLSIPENSSVYVYLYCSPHHSTVHLSLL